MFELHSPNTYPPPHPRVPSPPALTSGPQLKITQVLCGAVTGVPVSVLQSAIDAYVLQQAPGRETSLVLPSLDGNASAGPRAWTMWSAPFPSVRPHLPLERIWRSRVHPTHLCVRQVSG